MRACVAVLAATLAAAHGSKHNITWAEAHARAKPIVSQMTMQDKASLMLGIGWQLGTLKKWWYVGNLPAIPRLGVPTLRMQDSAGGFRTYWTPLVGTVTCWPSLLSMAATFDVDIVHRFAQALASEFAAKGANVVLGPSINVHRVARNGRNFEYLSGEDPYLGARLTEQYVHGVQSQGVMAVMKHWVFNSQETHRNSESSIVDEKTAHELYYPPFEAGVNAGVSGVMCSYNRIGGADFSCEHDATLNETLKRQMGFRGFVQSDWGATHSTAAASKGLDQEMPMAVDPAGLPYYFGEARLKTLPPGVVDASAERVVAAMIRMGLLYNQTTTTTTTTLLEEEEEAGDRAPQEAACTPLGGDTYASGSHVGCCPTLLEKLIDIEGHPRWQYICVAPPGRCDPPAEACMTVDAASAAHAAIARASAAASIVLLQNDDSVLPLRSPRVATLAIVGSVANGSAFDPTSDQGHGTWNTGDYYSGGGSGHVTAGRVVTTLAGLSSRAAKAGMKVVGSPTDNVAAATAAVKGADVAIVVAGATSGEALDRKNLSLDHRADALIAAVAATGTPTVVLMQVPGAILTPWRRSVKAAAILFLGGQETGGAWADVLFGDVAPTGKLPVVLPASEADTIAPSPNQTVNYTEGLRTSYRNTLAAPPAFPFGHGLSYTTFAFRVAGPPRACAAAALCVDATATNTGPSAAATVVQLYVRYPPEASQPAPLLKGFAKTPILAPAATHNVTFTLTERDLSYYDVDHESYHGAAGEGEGGGGGGGKWVKAGHVDVLLGGSSADIHEERRGVATA